MNLEVFANLSSFGFSRLNLLSFNCRQGDFAERVDELIKGCKAFVIGKAPVKSEIDLLRDNGDFERAENVIKENIGNVCAGFFTVNFY